MRATSLRNHSAGRGPCGQEGAGEVDAQNTVPILKVGVECQLVQSNAGIVDGNINAAIALNGGCDLGLALLRVGNVCLKSAGRAAAIGDG